MTIVVAGPRYVAAPTQALYTPPAEVVKVLVLVVPPGAVVTTVNAHPRTDAVPAAFTHITSPRMMAACKGPGVTKVKASHATPVSVLSTLDGGEVDAACTYKLPAGAEARMVNRVLTPDGSYTTAKSCDGGSTPFTSPYVVPDAMESNLRAAAGRMVAVAVAVAVAEEDEVEEPVLVDDPVDVLDEVMEEVEVLELVAVLDDVMDDVLVPEPVLEAVEVLEDVDVAELVLVDVPVALEVDVPDPVEELVDVSDDVEVLDPVDVWVDDMDDVLVDVDVEDDVPVAELVAVAVEVVEAEAEGRRAALPLPMVPEGFAAIVAASDALSANVVCWAGDSRVTVALMVNVTTVP